MIWLESLPDDWWKPSYETIPLSAQCIKELNIELLFLVRSLLLETRTYARVCKRVRLLANDFQNTLDARHICRSRNLTDNREKCSKSVVSFSSIIQRTDQLSSNIELIELSIHWLAIDGEQPIISENPLPNFLDNSISNKNSETNEKTMVSIELADQSTLIRKLFELARSTSITSSQIDDHVHPLTKNNLTIKPIHPRNISVRRPNINNNVPLSLQSSPGNLAHELSIEQQIHFKSLTESCFNGTNEQCIDAFQCLASDAALQPLLPRLLLFISKGIEKNIYRHDLTYVLQYLSILKMLTMNIFISFEKYLNFIIPSLLTCLVCIFDTPKNNNISSTIDTISPVNLSLIWLLREQASDLLSFFQNHYSTIPYFTQRVASILQSKLMLSDTSVTCSIVYASLRTLLLIDRETYSCFAVNILRNNHKIKTFEPDFDLDSIEQQKVFDQKITELFQTCNLVL